VLLRFCAIHHMPSLLSFALSTMLQFDLHPIPVTNISLSIGHKTLWYWTIFDSDTKS
jgi:hypothetical protein